MNIKKGAVFLKEGEVCQHLGFILEGYMRLYVMDEIDEKTVHISGPNNFICAFSSFISQKPSFEIIQAVSDCKVLVVSHEGLENIYAYSKNMERIGRLLLQHVFVEKEDRVISFIRFSSKDRYDYLIEKDPEIIFNVPLQYIASYLGVKPETLSRIRAKK